MIEEKIIARIISQVSATCDALGFDFFVIGAVAQQPWYLAGNEPFRGTNDVDFAVAVPGDEAYNQLRDKLNEVPGLTKKETNQFALITSDGYTIDLLPFKSLTNRENSEWTPKWSGIVNQFVGLKEVSRHALVERTLGSTKFQAASIPAIVLLKLLAFDDRPEMRSHDISDIKRILDHFPDLDADLVWENYKFVDDDTLSHDEIAWAVMGKELARISISNVELHQRMRGILTDSLEAKSDLLRQFILADLDRNFEVQHHRLKLLNSGFNSYTEKI